MNLETLKCSSCNKEKPFTDFGLASNVSKERQGRNYSCYDCVNESGRKKTISKTKHLRYNHGISEDEYLRMVEEQNGICPLCLKQKDLCVDHDHKTGTIRGLLCQSCNKGLGHFMDDPDALLRAMEYLKSPPHKPTMVELLLRT